MSLTESGNRLLADSRAMLDLAEEAEHRLRADQTTLSGHLRIFATIDSGQFIGTRILADFLRNNPQVTAELSFTNRPLHLIQEGCDVGIVAGRLMDDSVVARPAGAILHYLAASPALVKSRSSVKRLADLEVWPWIELSGVQFRDSNQITLCGPQQKEQTLAISPILISEGVTSIREAVLSGLGVALLPEWLIHEDILTGRLVRVLPAWRAHDLPMHVVYAPQRHLPARVRAFVDFAVEHLEQALRSKE